MERRKKRENIFPNPTRSCLSGIPPFAPKGEGGRDRNRKKKKRKRNESERCKSFLWNPCRVSTNHFAKGKKKKKRKKREGILVLSSYLLTLPLEERKKEERRKKGKKGKGRRRGRGERLNERTRLTFAADLSLVSKREEGKEKKPEKEREGKDGCLPPWKERPPKTRFLRKGPDGIFCLECLQEKRKKRKEGGGKKKNKTP